MAHDALRLAEVPPVETSDYSTPSSGILANRLLYAAILGFKNKSLKKYCNIK